MSTVDIKTEKTSSTRSLLATGLLAFALADFVNKARKAKDANDPLLHTDVIAAATTLFVLVAKRRQAKRGTAA